VNIKNSTAFFITKAPQKQGHAILFCDAKNGAKILTTP